MAVYHFTFTVLSALKFSTKEYFMTLHANKLYDDQQRKSIMHKKGRKKLGKKIPH